MEWNKKKVMVAGSGKSGIGAADLLKKLGSTVIIYDGNEKLNKEDVLAKLSDREDVKVILGELEDSVIDNIDLMILSPGIAIDAPFVNKVREKVFLSGEKLNWHMLWQRENLQPLQVLMVKQQQQPLQGRY